MPSYIRWWHAALFGAGVVLLMAGLLWLNFHFIRIAAGC